MYHIHIALPSGYHKLLSQSALVNTLTSLNYPIEQLSSVHIPPT